MQGPTKLIAETGCLLWLGPLKEDGSPRVWSAAKGGWVRARRWVYELAWEELLGPGWLTARMIRGVCPERTCVAPCHTIIIKPRVLAEELGMPLTYHRACLKHLRDLVAREGEQQVCWDAHRLRDLVIMPALVARLSALLDIPGQAVLGAYSELVRQSGGCRRILPEGSEPPWRRRLREEAAAAALRPPAPPPIPPSPPAPPRRSGAVNPFRRP